MLTRAIPSVSAIPPVDRTGTTALQQEAAAKLKTVAQDTTGKVVPRGPELRPNVQDYVDIDRTLIRLRHGI